jgi:hypothetical protein
VAIALGAALSVEVAHIIGNIEHAGERDLHSLLSAVSDETFSNGGPRARRRARRSERCQPSSSRAPGGSRRLSTCKHCSTRLPAR